MYQYTTDVAMSSRDKSVRPQVFAVLLIGLSTTTLILGFLIGYALNGFGA